MKVSEIKISEICTQIRQDESYLIPEEKTYLEIIKKASIEYVLSYTGLTAEEIDAHEDITVAVLVLISDMYDNRQMYVDKGNANKVVETILGMYCVNLL